jgi:hypothetical protein
MAIGLKHLQKAVNTEPNSSVERAHRNYRCGPSSCFSFFTPIPYECRDISFTEARKAQDACSARQGVQSRFLKTTADQLPGTKHGGYILPLRIVNAVPEAHAKAKRGVPNLGLNMACLKRVEAKVSQNSWSGPWHRLGNSRWHWSRASSPRYFPTCFFTTLLNAYQSPKTVTMGLVVQPLAQIYPA